MKVLGLVVVLAACELVQTKSTSAPTTPSAPRSEARNDEPPVVEAAPPASDGSLVVPNLLGLSLDDATAAVARAGFRQPLEHSLNIACAPRAHAADGAVKCQAPSAGEHARANMLVQVQLEHVVHSSIPTSDELGQIRYMTPDQVKQYLAGLGWHGEIVHATNYHFEDDAKCRPGLVCAYQDEFSRERLIIYVMPN